MAADAGPKLERKAPEPTLEGLRSLSSPAPEHDSLHVSSKQQAAPDLKGSLSTSHPDTLELQRRLASRLERAQAQALENIEKRLANTAATGTTPELAPKGLRQKIMQGFRKIFPHDRQSIIGKFVYWLGDALVKLEKMLVRIAQAILRIFGLRFGSHISFQRQNTVKATEVQSTEAQSQDTSRKLKKKMESGRGGPNLS